jgi:hypothetical protein
MDELIEEVFLLVSVDMPPVDHVDKLKEDLREFFTEEQLRKLKKEIQDIARMTYMEIPPLSSKSEELSQDNITIGEFKNNEAYRTYHMMIFANCLKRWKSLGLDPGYWALRAHADASCTLL